MKNKNLWLSFIIFVGIIFLLTWVIPSTSPDQSGKLVLGQITSIGVWDIFDYMAMLPLWFGQNFIYVIFMAIFYGVLNKTGALRLLEEKIVSRFKKHEKVFLIISSSLFILVASLTGIYFPLIFFIPVFIGIILQLGFSKITALVATVVSILVGVMSSLYSTFLFSTLGSSVVSGISYGWYKVALLVAGLGIVNLFLHFTAKTIKGKDKEEINEEMLFINKIEGQKKPKLWPIITVFSIVFVLLVLGMTSWSNMYKLNIFSDFNTWLMGLKIGNFAVFKGFFGSSVLAFGTWTITEVTALIAILTLVLVFVYKIKWDEVYEGAVAGITKMLPVVMLVILSNIVFIFVTQSGILYTILNFFTSMTKGINAFTYSIASFLGGSLVGNENYVSGYVTQLFDIVLGDKANLTLLVLIQQIMYGFAMIFVPTSAILLAGLAYLEVGYTKWIKKVWPLLLGLLVVSLIIIVLAVML
jgi:uncharacterized ion transporter superfamily protein YfcC